MPALDIWLPAWRRRDKIGQHALGVRHIMIAICDHFEPEPGADAQTAQAAVRRWQNEFPQLAAEFRDADGASPKHTFFHSLASGDDALLENLAGVCPPGGCETEIFLRHEDDTAANLQHTLQQGAERLAGYGLLARDDAGALRYGVIHAHGALDNSHPQGRHCGVRNELTVLRQTGCYADFTLPSAPERTQTSMINALYYARATDRPKSHDDGRRVRTARDSPPPREDELLIIQGPLALDWRQKRYGFLPRIENSTLSAAHPPTRARLRTWLDCRITVENRPNWLFIKLQTRGAHPENTSMLLGEPMRAFHRALAEIAAADHTLRFHYVTARELVNIVHAAESGHSGDPGQFRDYRYRRSDAGQPAGEAPSRA